MNAPSIVRTNAAELYDAYVMKNYAKAPLTLVRGEGVWAWDDTGKKYLDFASGIAVNALGHCHPVWVEAIRRQAGELIHCSNLYRNPLHGRRPFLLYHRWLSQFANQPGNKPTFASPRFGFMAGRYNLTTIPH